MTKSKPFVLFLAGATASGKTGLAIELAQHFGCDIISADSRQVYRELKIGVARPTKDELEKAKHHLIAHRSIHDRYSAADFREEALELIANADDEVIIVTGGTGLYYQALLYGFDESPKVDDKLRQEINRLYSEQGLEGLQKRLIELDPNADKTLDFSNPQRLKRAIEQVAQTGKSLHEIRAGKVLEFPYSFQMLQLVRPRTELHQRINKRVEIMMKDGLLEEVKSLQKFQHLNALQSVGYSELFKHLNGEISLDGAIELIKRNTRRYAKRQETWFRNKLETHVLHPAPTENIVSQVVQLMNR